MAIGDFNGDRKPDHNRSGYAADWYCLSRVLSANHALRNLFRYVGGRFLGQAAFHHMFCRLPDFSFRSDATGLY